MFNAKAAAREIKATCIGMGHGDTLPLRRVWHEIGGENVMAWTEFQAGVVHLARTDEDVMISPALYPVLYKPSELEAVVRFGGRDCNTIYIR